MFKEERRKMLKSNRIDDSIKININLQQPSITTTSESSILLFTKDIKKLTTIVKNQNLQIQLLQEKTDSLETKDSEKQAQIQSKNDEITQLKRTIQSQQENYLFLLDSNAKLWSTLNNLEKRISSNSKNSESISKEITFLDIKKYLHKNPKEAADVERIARDVKYSLEKELLDLNKSDSESEKSENELRKTSHKSQRRMGEKSYKQKNVDDYFKSTKIDKKLEKFSISNTTNKKIISRHRRSLSQKNSLSNIQNSFIDATFMPDQFDDDADWSSSRKNDSDGDDIKSIVSEANTFVDCRRSPSYVTQQPDYFDDMSSSDDENVILKRRRRIRLSTVLENPNIEQYRKPKPKPCSKQYRKKMQSSIIEATGMPDQFDDNDDWSLSQKNDSEEKKLSSSEKNDSKNFHQSMNEIQNSFIEATAMPDQFYDNADWSSCEQNDSKNLDQAENENDFYMEIPNNFYLWSKNQNKSIEEKESKTAETEMKVFPDKFVHALYDSDSDVSVMKDQFDDNYSDDDNYY